MIEFRGSLDEIDANVPPQKGVHLVFDKTSSHKTELAHGHDWLARRLFYHQHFTSASASWINQVERLFALLTQKQVWRCVHGSVDELEQTSLFQASKSLRWTKSADDILASAKRFCEATLQIHFAVV